MHTKRNLYEKVGVREYWMVQPTEAWVMIYLLDAQGQYGKPELFKLDEASPVALFPELMIEWGFLSWINRTSSTPKTHASFRAKFDAFLA